MCMRWLHAQVALRRLRSHACNVLKPRAACCVALCSRGIEANIHTYSALMSVCVKCK